MKTRAFIAIILFGFWGVVLADAIDQMNMGIGEDNVFSDATPSAFAHNEAEAGKSELLPIAYSTLPPGIPHTIAEYLPITIETNDCAECHDRQKK